MTNIPSTAKAFERWLDEQAGWPLDLREKAHRCLLTLKTIEGNPPSTIQAIEAQAGQTWSAMVHDLTDFAESYGAWRVLSRRGVP